MKFPDDNIELTLSIPISTRFMNKCQTTLRNITGFVFCPAIQTLIVNSRNKHK